MLKCRIQTKAHIKPQTKQRQIIIQGRTQKQVQPRTKAIRSSLRENDMLLIHTKQTNKRTNNESKLRNTNLEQ